MGQNRILVIDADPVVRSGICSFLVDQGFLVGDEGNCRDALKQLYKLRPDAIILDAHLAHADVPQLVEQAKALHPGVAVLLLAGQMGQDSSSRPFPAEIEGVLAKPVDMSELRAQLLHVLKARKPPQSLESPPKAASDGLDPFLGSSAAMVHLRQMAARIVLSQSPVLIEGETGTGKGVLAKWIHRNGPRAHQPFLDLNCAGLSRELLESELFGHQKGAFTSATSMKQGLLEVANGGTVFLDEIGDMDLQVQSKLLKVLEDRSFRRLGDVRDRAIDMRLISATHRVLQDLVREQRFRSDLFYRVNIVWLKIPPLRQRVEDIAALSRYLLRTIGRQWGQEEMQISGTAMRALESYSWPGNIRELRNVLERALLLAESKELQAEHLQFQSSTSAAVFRPEHGHGTLKQMERAYISHVLEAERGSVDRAARRLGIPRSSLYNKMRRFDIAQGTGRRSTELTASAAD